MTLRRASARTGVLLGVLLVLTGAVMFISRLAMRSGPRAVSPSARASDDRAALASLSIPEFELVDQDGIARTRDFFKGRRTILAFTFTHCPTACPIMYSHLIRLQEELKGVPVHTVSITVDPAHDSPAVLKAHAERLSIDTSRWTFLTGDAATISRILDSLKFSIDSDPAAPVQLPGGETMPNIIHPTKLLLIGPDAEVEALDDGLSWEGASRLARRARSPR